MSTRAKVICPTCEKEGVKSLVFYNYYMMPYSRTGGYFDYDGNWVQPRLDLAPWYQCNRGHIWQKSVTD